MVWRRLPDLDVVGDVLAAHAWPAQYPPLGDVGPRQSAARRDLRPRYGDLAPGTGVLVVDAGRAGSDVVAEVLRTQPTRPGSHADPAWISH